MPHVRRLLPLLLLGACTTSGAASEQSTPPAGAAAMATDASTSTSGTASAASIDGTLVELAATANKVEKIKLRTTADGTLVKQALYHDKADAIPEPVHALASKEFPKGTIIHYETELYADLGRVYEIELDDGGKACEVAATEDGSKVYTECQIDPTTLSAAVKATIDKVAPGGKILEAETKKGPSVDETTVEVQVGDRELYLRIGPDGALIQALRRIPAIVEVPLP
ncbi:MAG: hypothetical protein AAGF11_44370 [Myxococcota bacterium]